MKTHLDDINQHKLETMASHSRPRNGDTETEENTNLNELIVVLQSHPTCRDLSHHLQEIVNGLKQKPKKRQKGEKTVVERRKKVLNRCNAVSLKIWKMLVEKPAQLRDMELSVCEYLLSTLEDGQSHNEETLKDLRSALTLAIMIADGAKEEE